MMAAPVQYSGIFSYAYALFLVLVRIAIGNP
jgi:hypothetical protein